MFGLSFLNSAFLIFLTTLIIPIIIYLITKRKPQRVYFSSIRFIKESIQQRKKKINLKNLLLLLIRILILLFTIMGISRPVIKSSKGIFSKEHPKTAIALIVDNSYSMDYLIDTQTDLEKAKDICKRINGIVNNNDVLILVTRDDNWNKINSFVNYGKIEEELIDKIDITPNALSISSAMKLANKLLIESQYINKQIFIITDYQKENYPEKSKVPVTIIKTSDFKFKKNLACNFTSVKMDFTGDKKKRKIYFNIKNYSNTKFTDVICKLNIDEKTVSEKVISLLPFQEKSAFFDVNLSKEGWHSGYIKVKNERLEFDNKNYFTFFVKENPKIALISSEKDFPVSLLSILEIYSDDISVYNAKEINTLKDYDNIVLYNPDYSEILKDFLNRENQKKFLAVITKDDAPRIKNLYQALFGIKINDYYQKEQDITIDKINKFDSTTKIISKNKNTRVNGFFKIKNSKSDVLLSASDYPIALKNDNGAILWTFSLDMDNPMVISELFPTFAYNCLMETGKINEYDKSFKVGDVIKSKSKKVILPDGKMRYLKNNKLIANKPGIYNFFNKLVSVNLNFKESDYRQNDKLGKYPVTYKKWKNYIFKNSFGKDVWKYFFLIALILFVIEMILVKTEERR